MKLFKRSETPAHRAAPVVVERASPVPTVTRSGPVVHKRGYSAAVPDRLSTGFGLFPASQREEIRRDLRGLQSHARHAAQNGGLARSYELAFRRHVIGPDGIRLKPTPRDPSGAIDTRAAQTILDGWTAWGEMGSPTVCGKFSWWGVECITATALAREGGALVRLHRGRRHGKFAFRVEPLAFDLLDLDYTMALSNGAYIEAGVECSPEGRPLAFHFWNAPQDAGHMGTHHRRRVRVPADQIVHVTIPEEIAQLHGIPRSSTALRVLGMMDKFKESALAAAHYGAANMAFFQSDTDGGLAAAADTEMDPVPLEAGTTAWLPPGVSVAPFDPRYPDAAVAPFLRAFQTDAAAGYGLSAETLTGDLSNANFSTLRAGKGEERDEWRMIQRAVHEGLHGRVFKAWLEMALLASALRPLPAEKLDKFSRHEWKPRGWASVNPKEDAASDTQNIANGTTSRTAIAARQGRDFADVVAELEAEAEAMKTAGIAPPPSPPGKPPPKPEGPENED